MVHCLKTWPEPFEGIYTKKKRFEMRLNNRDYKKGDILHLQEYDPKIDRYSGREVMATVDYILHGGQFGIEPEYCCMSIDMYWWRDEKGCSKIRI